MPALGATNARIAQGLRITGATVRKHYFRIRWCADAKFGGGHQIPTASIAKTVVPGGFLHPRNSQGGGYLTTPSRMEDRPIRARFNGTGRCLVRATSYARLPGLGDFREGGPTG